MTADGYMRKLAKGDIAAFDGVYEQTRRTVYFVALSVLRDKYLAEDVMQTVYLRVLRYAAQYRHGTNAVAWIARIARNEALNLYKSRRREQSIDVAENETLFGTTTDEYGELTDLARRVLAQDEFAVLMLAAAEGYKRREIGEILEMPTSTVTYKYEEAKKKMRKALGEDGNGK